MNELTILPPDETREERAPWPRAGHTYEIIFEVEHLGLHWDDEPAVTILDAPYDIAGIFDDHTLRELCADDYKVPDDTVYRRWGESIPLASGIYRGRFEFWFHDCSSWEDSYPEFDYGFFVKALERLDNLPMEHVQ